MLKRFVKKHDIRFPIAHDARYEAAQKYSVRGTPTTYLITSDGKIIGAATGPRQWDSAAAQKMVQLLLKDVS
jgi:peroxiredoxin